MPWNCSFTEVCSKFPHVTNAEVLRRMNKELEVMTTIKARKLQYVGYIMQNKSRYALLQSILQGKTFGKSRKRVPGRRRISWLKNLRTLFDKSSPQLFHIAANKVKIAIVIANIRNGQARQEEEKQVKCRWTKPEKEVTAKTYEESGGREMKVQFWSKIN